MMTRPRKAENQAHNRCMHPSMADGTAALLRARRRLAIGIFLVASSFAVGAVIAFTLVAVSLVGLLLQIAERRRS